MRTIEEIAIKNGMCTCDDIYTARGLKAPDCPFHSMGVEDAMREYAAEVLKEAAKRVNKLNIPKKADPAFIILSMKNELA